MVLGAGPLGLLATMALRVRGLEVITFARAPRPNANADLMRLLTEAKDAIKVVVDVAGE